MRVVVAFTVLVGFLQNSGSCCAGAAIDASSFDELTRQATADASSHATILASEIVFTRHLEVRERTSLAIESPIRATLSGDG